MPVQMQSAQPWGDDLLLQWPCITSALHVWEHGEKQHWDLAGAEAESVSELVERCCRVLFFGAAASLQSNPAPLGDKQVLGNGSCATGKVSVACKWR